MVKVTGGGGILWRSPVQLVHFCFLCHLKNHYCSGNKVKVVILSPDVDVTLQSLWNDITSAAYKFLLGFVMSAVCIIYTVVELL